MSDVVTIIAGASGVGLTVSVGTFHVVRRIYEEQKKKNRQRDLDHIALYGQLAEGPIPAIRGLIAEVPHISTRLESVEEKVKSLDKNIAQISAQLKPNGGSTMADKINKILERLETNDA